MTQFSSNFFFYQNLPLDFYCSTNLPPVNDRASVMFSGLCIDEMLIFRPYMHFTIPLQDYYLGDSPRGTVRICNFWISSIVPIVRVFLSAIARLKSTLKSKLNVNNSRIEFTTQRPWASTEIIQPKYSTGSPLKYSKN